MLKYLFTSQNNIHLGCLAFWKIWMTCIILHKYEISVHKHTEIKLCTFSFIFKLNSIIKILNSNPNYHRVMNFRSKIIMQLKKIQAIYNRRYAFLLNNHKPCETASWLMNWVCLSFLAMPRSIYRQTLSVQRICYVTLYFFISLYWDDSIAWAIAVNHFYFHYPNISGVFFLGLKLKNCCNIRYSKNMDWMRNQEALYNHSCSCPRS